jgi:hypothetical protein
MSEPPVDSGHRRSTTLFPKSERREAVRHRQDLASVQMERGDHA